MRDMQCWQCGVTIKPGQKLCVYCGAKLNQDGDAEYDVPADRGGSSGRDRTGGERDGRYSSSGGGSRGRRAPEDDGWSAPQRDDARSDRNGQRERDDVYRPGGARGSSRDPLDDPRAPRSLRGASSSGRSAERGRGGYGGQDYEYDDYNPRDRTSPHYQPRFDPDSAEYDAVADQSRQSRLRSRREEAPPARSYEWDDSRAGRPDDYGRGSRGAMSNPRDARYGSDRDRGYGAYGEGESAEYRASYDDRSSRRDRGAGPSRGGRGAEMDDQQGYGGGWDQYDDRSAGGYDAPALGRPNAPGWNGGGAWAPGGNPNEWAPPGAAIPPKKGGRRGLGIALVALLVVVLLVGGSVLARGQILALLHRGGASGTPTPPAFATYTPGPTPTVLSSYKLYADSNAKYIIEYPSSWSIQNQNSTTGGGYDYLDTFERSSPVANVVVETAQALNNASNDDIINGEVAGAKQGGLSYTQVGADVSVSIGGETWTRRDYSVKASNGVMLHQAILVTHHIGRGYAIALTSAASTFVQDNAGVYKTMLSTFRFTS